MLLEKIGQESYPLNGTLVLSPKAQIEVAYNYASIGAFRYAQEACAIVVANDLLDVAANPALTLSLMQVLLLSEGYQQLSRLLRAISGIFVAIEVAGGPHPIDRPDFAVHSRTDGLWISLRARILRQPNGADMARCWANEILQAVTQ